MKKKLLETFFYGILLLGLTGCGNVYNDNNVSYDELNEVNNNIIVYFTLNGVDDYNNYSYNYIDEKDKVVVVGLLDNSKEKQEEFKRLIVNSDLIKFEKGEVMVDESINGDDNHNE